MVAVQGPELQLTGLFLLPSSQPSSPLFSFTTRPNLLYPKFTFSTARQQPKLKAKSPLFPRTQVLQTHFCFFFFFFKDGVLSHYCSPGWPGICYAALAGLNWTHGDSPAPPSECWDLKACITMTLYKCSFKKDCKRVANIYQTSNVIPFIKRGMSEGTVK